MPSYISPGRPSTDLTTVHPACSPSQRPSILGDSIEVFIHQDLIHWKFWKCNTIRSWGECCLRMELDMHMIDSPLKALKKMINIPIQIFIAYTQEWADFKRNVGKKTMKINSSQQSLLSAKENVLSAKNVDKQNWISIPANLALSSFPWWVSLEPSSPISRLDKDVERWKTLKLN